MVINGLRVVSLGYDSVDSGVEVTTKDSKFEIPQNQTHP